MNKIKRRIVSYIEKLENQVEAQFLEEEIYYQQEKAKQGAGGANKMNEEPYVYDYTAHNNNVTHRVTCRKLYQMAEDLMRNPEREKAFQKWQAERQKATVQEG